MIRVHQNAACPGVRRRHHPCPVRRCHPARLPLSPPARLDAPRCDHRIGHPIDRHGMRGLKPAAHLPRLQWVVLVQETALWTSVPLTTSSLLLTTGSRPTLGRLRCNASPLCSISVRAHSARRPAARASRRRRRRRRCSCHRICRICRSTSTTCRSLSFRLKVGAPHALAAPKKKRAPPAWPSSGARLTSTPPHYYTSSRASSLERSYRCLCRCRCRHCHYCPMTANNHKATSHLNIRSEDLVASCMVIIFLLLSLTTEHLG